LAHARTRAFNCDEDAPVRQSEAKVARPEGFEPPTF